MVVWCLFVVILCLEIFRILKFCDFQTRNPLVQTLWHRTPWAFENPLNIKWLIEHIRAAFEFLSHVSAAVEVGHSNTGSDPCLPPRCRTPEGRPATAAGGKAPQLPFPVVLLSPLCTDLTGLCVKIQARVSPSCLGSCLLEVLLRLSSVTFQTVTRELTLFDVTLFSSWLEASNARMALWQEMLWYQWIVVVTVTICSSH